MWMKQDKLYEIWSHFHPVSTFRFNRLNTLIVKVSSINMYRNLVLHYENMYQIT